MRTHGVIKKLAMIRSAIRIRNAIKALKPHLYAVSNTSPSSSTNDLFMKDDFNFSKTEVKPPGGVKDA